MTEAHKSQPYRVLARKYRPKNFSDMIGQEAMVRTLTNAIQTGRLAQAFVMTGVRGVGKTTTARIIARALNCIGPDGTGGPTAEPCGICNNCVGIYEGRHVDVIEMDAASNNGVDAIREINDAVRYRPSSARFKIYVLDEAHMLSTQAWNALLKTLEEPPEHVKFIFATTEIRKIPITVLSRCQRFDLRRVELETLAQYFETIVQQEGADIEGDALRMIARAADGSVRDGLSLLDQAIAHGAGKVSADQVRDMLGLADRARVFDLFDAVMRGDIAASLVQMQEQYNMGADPAVVLQDMLELTHWLTRLKIAPNEVDDRLAPETERVRGRDMAGRLSMAILTRSWQMLLKGLQETRNAPSPLQAAEMALVRLAYAADLPSPADLAESLRSGAPLPQPRPQQTSAPAQSSAQSEGGGSSEAVSQQRVEIETAGGGPQAALRVVAQPQPKPPPPVAQPAINGPKSFREAVAMLEDNREALLATQMRSLAHLVKFAPGHIEVRLKPEAPPDLSSKVGRMLSDWTGSRWFVAVSDQPGEPTLVEQDIEAEQRRRDDAAADPLVQAVILAFPGTIVEKVLDLAPEAEDEEAELTLDPPDAFGDFTIGEDE